MGNHENRVILENDEPARLPILERLCSYRNNNPDDGYAAAIVDLIAEHSDCFERHCFDPGHVTGSALLVSADNRRVLMNHHAVLGKWIGFGGHADGETDIAAVARREVEEESGLRVEPVLAGIFDTDIHLIPPNPARREPEHLHFDIRYLLRVVGSEDFAISAESNDLRWCNFEEAVRLTDDASMQRLLRRWHAQR